MTALTLVDKIRILDAHLRSAGIDYILGGALALGYNVAEPRGTQDIDVQVYPRTIDELVAALPDGVEVTATALADRWLRNLGMDDRANRLAGLGPR